MNEHVSLDGCRFKLNANYSGTVVAATITQSVWRGGLIDTRLHNLSFINSDGLTSQRANAGTALSVSSVNANSLGTGFLEVDGLVTVGMGTTLTLSATNGGWANGNMFRGVRAIFTNRALNLVTDSTTGSQVAGNNFADWIIEATWNAWAPLPQRKPMRE